MHGGDSSAGRGGAALTDGALIRMGCCKGDELTNVDVTGCSKVCRRRRRRRRNDQSSLAATFRGCC